METIRPRVNTGSLMVASLFQLSDASKIDLERSAYITGFAIFPGTGIHLVQGPS